jgi:hypothetical protein
MGFIRVKIRAKTITNEIKKNFLCMRASFCGVDRNETFCRPCRQHHGITITLCNDDKRSVDYQNGYGSKIKLINNNCILSTIDSLAVSRKK